MRGRAAKGLQIGLRRAEHPYFQILFALPTPKNRNAGQAALKGEESENKQMIVYLTFLLVQKSYKKRQS